MINTIKRAPNDEFTFGLFKELLATVDADFEAYYIWSNPPKRLKRILETTEFTQPNVILGIKDLLDQWLVYNWWEDRTQAGTYLIDQLASRHPDKNFIVFTSLENIQAEEIVSPNIQFVCWGGDISNQFDQYPTIEPVLDKNLYSEKPYISLNRNCREHRVAALSYLFGQGYDKHGLITFLSARPGTGQDPDLESYLAWDFESIQADFFVDHRKIIKEGYLKFCASKSNEERDENDLADDYDIYEDHNDNVTNFNLNLKSMYCHSFVEIVSESSFSAPGYNVTEKTLNSIYGCNFPILLGGQGIVQLLRDIGFDMFDDVVDHHYDTIGNPFNRIINAIEGNKQLLLDFNYAKEKWSACQHRFASNVEVARTRLYPWYRDRAQAQFNGLKWL
jgi:hypothetical protein